MNDKREGGGEALVIAEERMTARLAKAELLHWKQSLHIPIGTPGDSVFSRFSLNGSSRKGRKTVGKSTTDNAVRDD